VTEQRAVEDMLLQGRHALVTGASRGIGAATARTLAAAGARVSLLAREREPLTALERSLREAGFEASPVVADVVDANALDAAFAAAMQTFGPVDILVNNAGRAESRAFAQTDPEFWAEMLDLNVSAAYRCTRLVTGGMLERGWGRIVNVASTAGLTGAAYVSAYCAAKHALVGLTRALAAEFATRGVTVNAVCPGYTQTDSLEAAVANVVRRTGRDPADARAAILQSAGQRRAIRPEEVARVVVRLCAPESDGRSGEAIPITGDAP
jgi:NAD(P)-dependent dehydrogenase (short-subunit alcohol dehydrogenase family)